MRPREAQETHRAQQATVDQEQATGELPAWKARLEELTAAKVDGIHDLEIKFLGRDLEKAGLLLGMYDERRDVTPDNDI